MRKEGLKTLTFTVRNLSNKPVMAEQGCYRRKAYSTKGYKGYTLLVRHVSPCRRSRKNKERKKERKKNKQDNINVNVINSDKKLPNSIQKGK